VRLTLGKMSAAKLAAGKPVGNAEWIGKRQIITGQAKCACKLSLRKLIYRHKNFFIRTTHPDFSGFPLNSERVGL
jgi:hypothetical protein